MELPTINIPAKVRFALYIFGALLSLGVAYAVDKAWAGDAEVRLSNGIVALLFVLAAAKTTASNVAATVQGTVVAESGETGYVDATIAPADNSGTEETYEEAGGHSFPEDPDDVSYGSVSDSSPDRP